MTTPIVSSTPVAPNPATLIGAATPAQNAAGHFGATARASGPGGMDRAMMAVCESLAAQLAATPAGQDMAASIGRAGRQARTEAEIGGAA